MTDLVERLREIARECEGLCGDRYADQVASDLRAAARRIEELERRVSAAQRIEELNNEIIVAMVSAAQRIEELEGMVADRERDGSST